MAKLSQFKTDAQAEVGGAWVPYTNTDAEFLIARADNPEFEAAAREERRRLNLDARDVLDMSTAENRVLFAPLVARFLWKGTRGLVGDAGEPVGESPEDRERVLKDPECHDLYAWVIKQSQTQAHFRRTRLANTKSEAAGGACVARPVRPGQEPADPLEEAPPPGSARAAGQPAGSAA